MTDFFDIESQSDDAPDQSRDADARFACSRRFVDLTHTLEVDGDTDAPGIDEYPSHPEIIELLNQALIRSNRSNPSTR